MLGRFKDRYGARMTPAVMAQICHDLQAMENLMLGK
jgi:hypothetical protein